MNLRYVVLAACVSSLGVGCTKRHREPPPDRPHALLKFRTHYAVSFPATLEEWVRVNGRRVPIPDSVGAAGRKRMDVVRLEIGAATISIASQFTETVSTHGPQGHGTATVNLGECGQAVELVTRERAVYFLDFTFSGHGSCTMACKEQVFEGDGSRWTWIPCETGFFPSD